jgi:uncharacterized protein with ATP-grasp and redox domains
MSDDRFYDDLEIDQKASYVTDDLGRRVFDRELFQQLRRERNEAKIPKIKRADFDQMPYAERSRVIREGARIVD